MAQRTGFGAPFELFPFAMLHSRTVAKVEKRKAIPACARRLGDRATQRRVDPAVAFEAAIGADVDDDVLSLESADERRPRQRQPRIERWLHSRLRCAAIVNRLPQEVPGRPDTEISIVGDLECTPAGALGQAAPRVRLDAPGDAAEQELLVIGSGFLAEHLAVLLLELRRGQAHVRA